MTFQIELLVDDCRDDFLSTEFSVCSLREDMEL